MTQEAQSTPMLSQDQLNRQGAQLPGQLLYKRILETNQSYEGGT